jgi:hypothetical protein
VGHELLAHTERIGKHAQFSTDKGFNVTSIRAQERGSWPAAPLFMGELLAQLQPGEAVLELGYGRGLFAYADHPILRIRP